MFHSRTVLSAPVLTTYFPPGLKLTFRTLP